MLLLANDIIEKFGMVSLYKIYNMLKHIYIYNIYTYKRNQLLYYEMCSVYNISIRIFSRVFLEPLIETHIHSEKVL